MSFRNGINFQLIRTSGSKMCLVFVEELWGSVCLSCRNQGTLCHRGFCNIRSYYSLKWVPDWLFPWQILIVMHLAIHLTPKRKWFTSLERYKVFHYLIISANSYSPHPLVSLIMVLPHQLSSCVLLSEAARPDLDSWIGLLFRKSGGWEPDFIEGLLCAGPAHTLSPVISVLWPVRNASLPAVY